MAQQETPPRKRTWQRILQISIGALFFALLCIGAVTLLRGGIEAIMPKSLPLAACVLLGLYALKSVMVVVPFISFFLYAGMAFPTGWAIVLSYMGLALDLTIGHWLGKRLGLGRVLTLLEEKPRTARLLAAYRANMRLSCVVMRMLPVPFEMTSMFFGASGLPYRWHLGISLVAVTPYALPYILAGEAMDNPLSAAFLVPVVISLAVAVGAVLLMRHIERKRTRQAEDGADTGLPE